MNHTPFPLRVRLALGYSLFFGVVLLVLSTGVYWFVRATLYAEIRNELAVSTELIQRDYMSSAAPLASYFRDSEAILKALPPHIQGLESPTLYVQVLAPDGTIEVTSHSLNGQTLPIDPQAHQAAIAGMTTQRIVPLGTTHIMQIMAPLSSGTQVLGVLQVAQPLQSADRALNILLLGLSLIGGCALLAALRGGTWLTRHALQPVEEIAHTARQIVEAADLARRVPAVAGSDEIAELTRTINAMLTRLEQLFSAQRRFVADVGHELRTPLTAMRGHLELLQRGVVTDAQARNETMTDLLCEVNRLSRMASDLLLLAQTEVGIQLRYESVALDELVLEVIRELRPLAGERQLRPSFQEQIAVIGDRDRLKQALVNLVANALQHTPAGGSITITLEQDVYTARLRVKDSGPGITEANLPRVFERFFQADRARMQRAGGAGLGLAIVQWVAEAHGGQITVESQSGAGACFILHIPRSSQEIQQHM